MIINGSSLFVSRRFAGSNHVHEHAEKLFLMQLYLHMRFDLDLLMQSCEYFRRAFRRLVAGCVTVQIASDDTFTPLRTDETRQTVDTPLPLECDASA